MRRKFDFYDFLFGNLTVLFLMWSVPSLPHWIQLSGSRRVIVAVMFLLGFAALRVFAMRPAFLIDRPTDRIDLYDLIIATAAFFFIAATIRSATRSANAVMTFHRSANIALIGLLAVFAIWCSIERGGLRKIGLISFWLAAIALGQGFWELSTGTTSKRYVVVATKEEGYGWLLFGAAFLVFGLIALFIQTRKKRF